MEGGRQRPPDSAMSFKTYVLLLCLFVFIAFTAVFTAMIVYMVKQQIKMIRAGILDQGIQQEFSPERCEKKETGCKICTGIVCGLVTLVFLFSAYAGLFGDGLVKNIPSVKVVASPSMSDKYEKNTYLFDHDLNNQLNTFDLIVLHKLPAEEDLQLYDIVVYQMGDYMVIHRIVGIEEPNEEHPNERHFLLQGDAAENPDRFPVRYSQMRSIYKGQRMPFVGSFVYFMQSPAGVLCYLLILFAVIATPMVEKKLKQEALLRLAESEEKAVAYAEV